MPKPVITRTATIARTRLFHVEALDLRFADGREANYERLRSGGRGAVLVVPMLDAGTVLMVREYAAAVDRYELTLPKGSLEDGESIEAAANRELMEEIGYGARTIEPLKAMTLAPGYFTHSTHIVLARDLYPQRLEGDEPEPLEVVPWALAELTRLIEQADCTEARSIAALFLARERMRGT